VRRTQRLADQGAVASVGSRGDSYDNALAEAVNGLYKAELIGPRSPWRGAGQVELATLTWVQWWNQRRLHGALDHIPPTEHEAIYYREHPQSKEVAKTQPPRPPSNPGQFMFIDSNGYVRSKAGAGLRAAAIAGRSDLEEAETLTGIADPIEIAELAYAFSNDDQQAVIKELREAASQEATAHISKPLQRIAACIEALA
jgi:putative transposase